MIRITTRDVGLTQVATIWVGETRAIEFFTGTRYEDRSKEIAEIELASAIFSIMAPKVRLWRGEPGGDYIDKDWDKSWD